MSALLEWDGLRVELAGGPVLRSVTLSIDAGEAVGLVGESGSGKSMTARSVLGLLPAGAKVGGAVRFRGQDVGGLDAAGLRRLRSRDVFPAGSPFDAPAVPVLLTIGWWDNCAPWQWSDYREIALHPAWSHNTFLLLEAIDHENNSHFDPHAERTDAWMDRYLAPAAEFFDVFLHGAKAEIPRVRWQLANSGDPALRDADSWPPAGVRVTALHPHRDGTLSPSPCPAPASMSWTHDASDPVPSPVSDPFSFLAESPDERSLADRSDVLVFTAAPAADVLDLVGPVTLTATVGSDGPTMDVFARLADVAPSGEVRLVARGQQTILDPGAAFTLDVDLGQIGYRLRPGHALRLTIASSDAPEFIPAPGTGEHRWLAATTKPNHQTLRLDDCRLTLTVLPS